MHTTDYIIPVSGKRIPGWTSAYYPGWRQEYLHPENIDYSVVTTIIHFAVKPGIKQHDSLLDPAGLDFETNQITPDNSAALLQAAHIAGTKVLFAIGGRDGKGEVKGATRNRFRAAISPENLEAFTTNLVKFLTNNGIGYDGEQYDGIDIDWQPVTEDDEEQYAAFIHLLSQKLSAIAPKPILTAAVKERPGLFARLHKQFEQINIISYNLAGNQLGSVTWHNAPIYDGGNKFPSNGDLLPSADGLVKAFINAGVPANKLAIGIDFEGKKWGGVFEPLQKWDKTQIPTLGAIPYFEIINRYYKKQVYHWDTTAQAAYLKINTLGSATDSFISYDDETSVNAKIDYVESNGLGGVIIWDLAAGWLPEAEIRDPLLQAIKNAAYPLVY
ncbi:MAG: glycosyl hydrolase family 18 protein [Aulosira sp. ZfuVER01]|nr:glycoside hydrolase family 18 protein [Aulosira sp. ZfuVER01]MDZ8002422.1 glycoside hydrolase family 18 protein [Aulosira sp. DedVER01a]MDZ8054135.1 glycoside hydrolase family 18 protein [Aulosira sp. ZfuCHP01]